MNQAESNAIRSSRRWLLVDVLLAVVLGTFAVVLLGLSYQQQLPGLPPFNVAAVAALATTLPLALRRLFPVAILAVVTAAFLWYLTLETQQISAPALASYVALFSVGAYSGSRYARPAQVAAIIAMLGYVALHLALVTTAFTLEWLAIAVAAVGYNALLVVAAALMGIWLRERDMYERELDRRARELEAGRVERERRAVQDERVRIARDLHDVVAHYVSLMGIQAGAARTNLRGPIETVENLLASIETTSRRALDELRRVLAALRDDETGNRSEEAPGLGQLAVLAASAESAGVEVAVEQGDLGGALPEALDRSAYRIVQEAITNSIRHGHAGHILTRIERDGDTLLLRVDDDGHRAAATPAGKGLIGMRERAALFGGTLSAGPKSEGGWRVEARLPLSND